MAAELANSLEGVVERCGIEESAGSGDNGSRHSAVYETLKRSVRRATSTFITMISNSSDKGLNDENADNIDSPSQYSEEELLARQKKKLDALACMEKLKEAMAKAEKKYVDKLDTIVKLRQAIEDSISSNSDSVLTLDSSYTAGHNRIVFWNIEEILNFHRNGFTQELCGSLDDPSRLVELIMQRREKFQLRYSSYAINKSRSDLVLKKYKKMFQDIETECFEGMRLGDLGSLGDYWLSLPIYYIVSENHFPGYLRKLKAYAALAEEKEIARHFGQAHEIIAEVATLVNNMMAAGGIQKFEGNITEQGLLVHKGDVQCKFNEKKGKSVPWRKSEVPSDGHIFFFEHSIVITEVTKRDPIDPEYSYRSKFSILKLKIRDPGRGGSTSFEIHEEDGPGSLTVICSSEKDKKMWVDKINLKLRQIESTKTALTNPSVHERA